MKKIPLLSIPNQSLSYSSGDVRYDLRIFSAGGRMCFDLRTNDVTVMEGVRIVAGKPLIPYFHLATKGNFAIISHGDKEPDWKRFNIDQFLVFGHV